MLVLALTLAAYTLAMTIGRGRFGALNMALLLAAFFAYLVYAANVEERSMMGQFPNEYPAYVHRTKMLIPFLF